MMPDVVWPFLVTGAFAIGLSVGMFNATRNRKKKLMTAWKTQLEERVHNVLEAHLYAAECEVQLAEMVKEVPKDFVSSVFRAMQLGHAVERAVIAQASHMGLTQGISLETEKVLHDEGRVVRREALPEEPEIPKIHSVMQENGPDSRWNEGKLIPLRIANLRKKTN